VGGATTSRTHPPARPSAVRNGFAVISRLAHFKSWEVCFVYVRKSYRIVTLFNACFRNAMFTYCYYQRCVLCISCHSQIRRKSRSNYSRYLACLAVQKVKMAKLMGLGVMMKLGSSTSVNIVIYPFTIAQYRTPY